MSYIKLVLGFVLVLSLCSCSREVSDGDASIDVDGDSVADADTHADSDGDGDSDVDSDVDSDGDSDVDSDGDSDGDADTDGEVECDPGYVLIAREDFESRVLDGPEGWAEPWWIDPCPTGIRCDGPASSGECALRSVDDCWANRRVDLSSYTSVYIQLWVNIPDDVTRNYTAGIWISPTCTFGSFIEVNTFNVEDAGRSFWPRADVPEEMFTPTFGVGIGVDPGFGHIYVDDIIVCAQ